MGYGFGIAPTASPSKRTKPAPAPVQAEKPRESLLPTPENGEIRPPPPVPSNAQHVIYSIQYSKPGFCGSGIPPEGMTPEMEKEAWERCRGLGSVKVVETEHELIKLHKYVPPDGFAEVYRLEIVQIFTTPTDIKWVALYRWHKGRKKWIDLFRNVGK